MFPKRSLILITVDCLRLDRLDRCLPGKAGQLVTPVLSRFAADSMAFPCAVVAGVPTFYSFPAIHSGRHPLALGRDALGVAPEEPTLASELHARGYTNAAFIAGNPYVSSRFGYHQGFDTFEDFLGVGIGQPSSVPEGEDGVPARPTGLTGWINSGVRRAASAVGLAHWYNEAYFRYGLWRVRNQDASMGDLRCYPAADQIVDRVGPWLAGLAGEPFFLWMHLMDPHHPYYPPQEALAAVGRADIDVSRARYLNSVWNRRDLEADQFAPFRDDILALYDAGVYWADKQIGRVLDCLQQFGLADDTVVAVTADHGEEFNEHGRRYHHRFGLPETLIRVPLLVRVPGQTGRVLPDVPFSQADLPATLLEAVGHASSDLPGKRRMAEMLGGRAESGVAITECIAGDVNPFRSVRRSGARLLSVHAGRYKLVWNLAEGSELLFDLQMDPQEKAPLPVGHAPEVRQRLLLAALDHVKRSLSERDPSLRLRARLRDLRLEGMAAFR